jgi:nitrite reductase/ring-hydroxylating ferredoxin subunit
VSDPVLVPLGAAGGRSRWTVNHGGQIYAVFVHDGEIVVTDGQCPHRRGPLHEGIVRDGAIVCPWHWYAFDLATGSCRTAEMYALRRYRVVLADGEAFAEIPSSARRSWSAILRAHAASESSADGQ